MAVVSARLMAAAVFARLDAHAALTVYESVVTETPPRDAGGKITSYAVFHPGPGDTTRNALSAVPGPLMWDFSVLANGGDHDYLLGAVDAVRLQLEGHRLVVAGTVVGMIQPPPGFRSAPARPDHDEKPSRLWIPLPYQVLAVPA